MTTTSSVIHTAEAIDSRVVRGACPHDCPDTCSLLTTVKGGIAIKVQGNPAHPQTGGVLCTKVSRYTERTYHPERLLTPLKRSGPKGSGQFVPVSWPEALDDIAARLKTIATRNPEAIVPYSYAGTMGLVQAEGMAARFFNRLGASLLDRTICSTAGGEGFTQTLGGKVGMKVEFFAESKLIIIWGSNSIGSNLHFWRYAQQAKRDGAKLVCIDPRKSETAEKCHEHIALLPGTDAALALALMHELIANDWLDHGYIAQHTLGWPELKARALEWPPARAAQVCGVPVDQIKTLARDYGQCLVNAQPAAIRLNYGMQRVKGGGNAARAVACLPALIGAWRHRAGGVLLSSSGQFPVQRAVLHRPELLAGRTPRTINMTTIGNDLLAPASSAFGPKIEALVVYNSNPLAIAPDSSKVAEGLAREDLFTVVLEHFQTDTADYADFILPATTQLEHWDVHYAYGHTDVLLNRPAIAPMGDAKPNTQIFRELATRMGFDEPCFADSDEMLCRQAYGDKVDFEQLLEQGFASLAIADAPFAQGGFPTPSGKCEFFSARLAARGVDGLPEHVPNYETPGSSAHYPLAMISPPARNFLNSTFVNLKSLRSIEGEPLLEIHADDAAARSITSGEVVRVFNQRGQYLVKAEVSSRARPGVVNGLGIWWRKMGLAGTNVNQLTSQQLTDLGAGPTFYDCLVEVSRVLPSVALGLPPSPAGGRPGWGPGRLNQYSAPPGHRPPSPPSPKSVRGKSKTRHTVGLTLLTSAAVLAATLSGCSSTAYYWQSVSGHLQMMNRARPVQEVLVDAQTPARIKSSLALSQRIRDFAATELKLPDNPSYRRYADLGRSAVVWNVVAAPPFSLRLKTWCFPVTGCVGYRGYFQEADARAEADALKAEGLEVSVYGVPAYSTLGWMNWAGGDPLLSTFIHYPEGELARLIFHELAHQVVFASGDTMFNESFATAVERLGSQRWLTAHASAAALAEYTAFDQRRQGFKALALQTRQELAAAYAQFEPNRAAAQAEQALAATDSVAATAAKEAVMQRFRSRYEALKASWGGYAGYDPWVARANNASFGAQAAYDELVPAFEALFERDGRDWLQFYDAVKQLANLPAKDRHPALKKNLTETPNNGS